MKLSAVLLLALIAVSGTACSGRKLLHEADGHDDASALDPCLGAADLSEGVKLLKLTNILEGGVQDATVFLPTNAAVAKLIASVGLPTLKTVDDLVNMLPLLDSLDVVPKFVSTLLYHFVIPSQTLAELAAEGTVNTALTNDGRTYTLEFSADGKTITTDSKQTVAVGAALECKAFTAYTVDAVLLPVAPLTDIPNTSVEEAVAILSGGGAGPAPAPGPMMGHHHDDMDMDTAMAAVDDVMKSVAGVVSKSIKDAKAATESGAKDAAAAVDGAMADVEKALAGAAGAGAAGGAQVTEQIKSGLAKAADMGKSLTGDMKAAVDAALAKAKDLMAGHGL